MSPASPEEVPQPPAVDGLEPDHLVRAAVVRVRLATGQAAQGQELLQQQEPFGGRAALDPSGGEVVEVPPGDAGPDPVAVPTRHDRSKPDPGPADPGRRSVPAFHRHRHHLELQPEPFRLDLVDLVDFVAPEQGVEGKLPVGDGVPPRGGVAGPLDGPLGSGRGPGRLEAAGTHMSVRAPSPSPARPVAGSSSARTSATECLQLMPTGQVHLAKNPDSPPDDDRNSSTEA